MTGKRLIQWIVFFSIPMILVLGCGDGSPDSNNDGNNLPIISTQRTRLVESGAQPVWVSDQNEQFLFSYKQGEGPEGIYLSDLDGNATSLWENSQNHDYVPSPDGSMVAFSVPGLDDGLVVVTIADGASSVFLAGGRHPAWRGDEDLIAETEEGAIVSVNLLTEAITQISNSGIQPVTDLTGTNVVYYRNAGLLGLRLMWQAESGEIWSSAVQIASEVGTDVIFSPTGASVYVSVLDIENQSVVTYLPLVVNPTRTPMLQAALRPSISGDGEHLYANRISSKQPRSLWHTSLLVGDLGIILDASFAAAEAQGKALLAESDWGIERITF
ncbi:MAG: hypothetical protein V2A56_03445 [bacterium]